jgi:hypothetical protein
MISPPCERVCRWVATFDVEPKEDKDEHFSWSCWVIQHTICRYKHVCRASTRISGKAEAYDNCLGCVARYTLFSQWRSAFEPSAYKYLSTL